MGSITSYEISAGRRYRARWRNDRQLQVEKKGFRTKREAELYLANIGVSMSKGSYTDPGEARITVGALGVDWLRNKKPAIKPSSYHSLDVAWRVYVFPRWGNTRIGDIRPSMVEQWIREISEGSAITNRTKSKGVVGRPRSASIVYRNLGVLAGILDTAVRDGRLPRNPARGAQNLPPKISDKPRRYLTNSEVIRFAGATTNDTHKMIVLILSYCGLRWSEAIGMHVRDINFPRRRILVSRAAVEVDGKIVVGVPKNWERRLVPFPAFLEDPLKRLIRGKGPEDLVICDAEGKHLRRPNTMAGLNSWFAKALEAADIDRLTPHDLRHTAASLAISSGANVKAVQRMLGHKSAAMTLDTYADLFDDDLDDVAGRMNQGGLDANVGRLWPV
ncbi:tyrosine-type recombinase/integrase [Microbacterium sp. NPDC076911]|uniref:tyrosine-type recombinase/integrase n=1 Tax=Microbacterium sp. NPDC076911 TaxID=3154958 RepID=UPI00341606F0